MTDKLDLESHFEFVKRIIRICNDNGVKVTLNPMWHRTTSGVYVSKCFDRISYIWTPFGELHLTGECLTRDENHTQIEEKLFWGQLQDVSAAAWYCCYDQSTDTHYQHQQLNQDDRSGNKFSLWKYTGFNSLTDQLYVNFNPSPYQHKLDKAIEIDLFNSNSSISRVTYGFS
jgi:hypothetical protein